ncbi:aminotransferase class I/II-fold pyridoxal phosphate-dependent enzyme [Streptomyces microflavus]|uniref:aminotransferase class I/II-fold pyridoxal phosphate-dependent enzyme n=1 Tax=Streptomyces microflavus TaxID=1919 RepID=UPI0034317708
MVLVVLHENDVIRWSPGEETCWRRAAPGRLAPPAAPSTQGSSGGRSRSPSRTARRRRCSCCSTRCCSPGDQVIAFNPGWQPLMGLPPRLGASVTVLPYGPGMSVDAAAVTAAAGENLRLIALSSPCSPTGLRVEEEEELRALVALVAERDAYLLVDEEYAIGLSRSPAVGQGRVISVSGLSRTCGLPGLRTGWVYGAPQVAEACAERTFLTSIANSVLCEALACSALDRYEDCVREYHRL